MTGCHELRQTYDLRLSILGKRDGFLSLIQSTFKLYRVTLSVKLTNISAF